MDDVGLASEGTHKFHFSVAHGTAAPQIDIVIFPVDIDGVILEHHGRGLDVLLHGAGDGKVVRMAGKDGFTVS